MPLKGFGSPSGYQNVGPTIDAPTKLTSAGGNTSNIGKATFDLTNPGESLKQSAEGFAGAVQGIGKAAVSIVENIPLAGLITKPVIGAVGAVADATVGKVVDAVAQSPIGEAVNTVAGKAVEVATLPLVGAFKALTLPGAAIQQGVAEARIRGTALGEQNVATLIFGKADMSAVQQFRDGKDIEEIAKGYVEGFGMQESKYGAFSQDAFANFVYTLLLDPVNIVPITKPITIASRAAKLSVAGSIRLRSQATKIGLEAAQAVKAGDQVAANRLKALAEEAADDADFLDKWDWAGKIYKGTWGKVADKWAGLAGGRLSRELAQQPSRIMGKAGSDLLDDIATTTSKDNVDEALTNAVLTTANANKAAVAETLVQTQRNVWLASSNNLVKNLYVAIGKEVRGVENLLKVEFGSGRTIGDFLKDVGFRKSEIDELISTVEKAYVPSPKAFHTSDNVRSVLSTLTDAMAKIDVKARPDFYINAADALGQSNVRFAVDAGIELIQRNKLRLTSIAADQTQFVDFMTRTLQFGFRISADSAADIAARQFAKHGASPRDLLNVLETARMASFGRAMREVALERQIGADDLAKLKADSAVRHEAVGKAYFPNLAGEEARAAGELFDTIATTTAAREGITPAEWYAKNTFGVSDLSVEDAAVSIADELYSMSGQVKGAFAKATTRSEILQIAQDIVPTKRMVEAGLGKKLAAEVIETPNGGFALPGGVAALDDAAPYNILDEVVIASQPDDVVAALPGDVRVKMHAKMTASKAIDMQDTAAVVNRVMFAALSPRRNLSSNAALYQVLRVRNMEDINAFVSRWGEKIKNVEYKKEGALGREIAAEFGLPTDKLGIASQLITAGRVMVYAAENPEFFKLMPGETMLEFGERLTLLKGAGLKVGVFGAEMMDTAAMSVGAIDSQMSIAIFRWAKSKGLADKLIKELDAIGTAESKQYLTGGTDRYLDDAGKVVTEEVQGMIKVLEDLVAGREPKGMNASGSSITLGKRTLAKADVPDRVKKAVAEMPKYMSGSSTPTLKTLKNSSFEVMIKYMDLMANDWAVAGRVLEDGKNIVYPGLDKLSGAQKQWFIWDITRQQIEPHFWLHRSVDKMAKPTPEQIKRALKAVQAAGGTQRTKGFAGVDPNIMAEFLEERGGQVLGKTQFDRKGRSAIQLFKGSDITTAIHEIGHVARRQLSRQDQRVVNAIYGVTDEWTVELEERFAKDFTNYMYSGKAPTPALIDLFGKIRAWMTELWSKVSGTEEINPELRGVFDRLLSHNGPQAIPDADTWSRITLISDRSLTQNTRDAIIRRVNAMLGEGDGSETLRSVQEANASVASIVDGGLVKPNDGASFNPIRDTKLVAGKDLAFTASTYPGREIALSGPQRAQFLTDKDFQKRVLQQFVKDNEDLISLDGHYVGLYDNGTSYSIDVSRSFDSVQDAIEAGTRANQEAIFALKGMEDIFLDTPLGRLAAAKKGRPIIRNASELSPADIAEWSKPRLGDEELEAMFRPLADELVANYEDVAVKWWNTGAKAIDIIDWVRDHPEIMVRELTETESRLLPAGFKAKEAAIKLGGYRYAVAPKGGIIERTTRVADGFGGTKISTSAQPFVDLLDNVAINKLDEIAGGASKRPTFLNKFSDLMTREYGPDVVRTNYIERWVTSITKKVQINTRDAEIILAKVGNLAARKETTVRGLWFERDQVQQIFREVMGDSEYFKYIEKNDPLTDLFDAAQGDVSVVGLLPGVSGRAKAWKPVMGAVTDRAYPLFRFGKGNPFFRQILEPIETKLMAAIDGIKRDQVDEFLGGKPSQLIQRMTQDSRNVTNEIAESVFFDQEKGVVSSLYAVRQAPEFTEAVGKVLSAKNAIKDGKWAITNPEEFKLITRDVMASEYAVDKVYDLLNQSMPETMAHLAEDGAYNGRQIMARILEDGMLQSSPEAFSAVLRKETGATIGLWSRALLETGMPQSEARKIAAAAHGVFADAMIRGTRRADKYQFFSSYRSWFERSINHPFLGIYPYSYMKQKAIPWMLKMMFAPKIGGHIRPGFGYINMMRLREYIAVDANTDRDFMTQIASARPLWYALNIMLPATPTGMGFAAPYWMRKGIIEPAQRNQPIDLNQISKVPPLIGETLMRGTVLGQGASLLAGADAFGDTVQDNLDGIQLDVNRFFNP
jgi:hypothetical protein